MLEKMQTFFGLLMKFTVKISVFETAYILLFLTDRLV